MLNSNVKQQINNARDILVGKIPDPKGQIDQITNALIYKFMDDQDRLSLTLPGGKANFFVDELKPYAWHKLFDTKLSNQDKANLYVEGVAKLSVSKHLPDLFQDIFKDAFLPFRAPDTIAMFLNEINKFDYKHSEDLGNAFEYLLSFLSVQGDLGSFRTPRNIIEFIVDAIDPSKDDSILDPACGTAGFLIEAYKHITKDKKLAPNEIQELAKHIQGVDIDPGMAKIARVNLYLHGFKTPIITEDDTLSDVKLWGKKYNVILANPPFMTPRGGIVPHDKFSLKSNRAEVLFTDYIAEHLLLNGRAGIVVPEGIIFQSGDAYKKLRKMLVDDNYLWGVISLPAGVFNPYSGVKTSILLLDRERATKNTEILFFKINNDGFDLGAQRRENSKNDLPEALEILKKWKNGEKAESSRAIYVEKEKIAESGDYNLSIDRYGIAIDYTNAKWPMVELGDVADILKGSVITKKDTINGSIPVIAGGQQPAYYHNKANRDGDVITVSASGAYAGFVNFFEIPIFASDCSTIQTKNNAKVSTRYIFNILKAKQKDIYAFQQGGGQPHVYSKDLKKIKLPLPPIEVQEEIVKQIEVKQKAIEGAKQVITNLERERRYFGQSLTRLDNIEMIRFSKICKINEKTSDPIKLFGDSDFVYIDISSVENGTGVINLNNFINAKDAPSRAKRIIKKGDVLLSTVRPNLKAFACIEDAPKKVLASTGFAILTAKEVVLPKYLFYSLFTDALQEQMVTRMGKGAYPSINQNDIEQLTIPLPSLDVQKKLVSDMEKEEKIIESNKKLIEIMENKINAVLNQI